MSKIFWYLIFYFNLILNLSYQKIKMEKKEITINSDELNIFKNMLNNLGDAINKFEKNYNKLSDSKYIQFNKIKINYLNKHLKIHF